MNEYKTVIKIISLYMNPLKYPCFYIEPENLNENKVILMY